MSRVIWRPMKEQKQEFGSHMAESPIISILQAAVRVSAVAEAYRQAIRDVAMHLLWNRMQAARVVMEDGNFSSSVIDIPTCYGYAHLVITAQFLESAKTPVRVWLYLPEGDSFTCQEFGDVVAAVRHLQYTGTPLSQLPRF